MRLLPGASSEDEEDTEILREQNCQDSVFGGGQRKGAQNDPTFHLGDQVDVVSLTKKGKQLWEQGNKILTLFFNMLI